MELAVEVPADAVKIEVEKVYATLQRSARVRGFRPGKAPRQVLAHLYAAQVANDAVNAIVNVTLPKALSEKNVQPVNQPKVEAGKFGEGSTFSYKATFEVQPEIENVVYEGLELTRPPEVATEEGVAEQLEALRRQHARIEAPESPRPAQKGDVLTIDFTIDVNGQEFKEGEGQAVQLELGSSQILPELDAGLTGAKVDDKLAVEAKFADTHARKELAGKAGTFRVHVKDPEAPHPAGDRRRVREGRRPVPDPGRAQGGRALAPRKDAEGPGRVRPGRADRREAEREEPDGRAALARRAAVPLDGDGGSSRTRAAPVSASTRRTSSGSTPRSTPTPSAR